MGSREILRQPLFRAGLALKLALVVLVVPEVQHEWFLPFVRFPLLNPGADPWTDFIRAGGDALAFPYGVVMVLAHLPTVAIGLVVDQLADVDYLAGVGFRASLLLADIWALLLLGRLAGGHQRALVIFYWLSPFSFYVTYWHGQTDVVPVVFLLGSLLYLKDARPRAAGIAAGLAIVAKLSMVLAGPFLLLYLWVNKRTRDLAIPFAAAAAWTMLVAQGPWLASPGFREMVFGSREIGKVYQLSLELAPDLALYLTPLVYLLLLYVVWRFRRQNFELLLAVLGVVFFAVVLMTPASVGWYLWVLPFLALYQARVGGNSVFLTSVFALLLISHHLLYSQGAKVPFLGLDYTWQGAEFAAHVSGHARSLWLTLITAFGVVLAVGMYRRGITDNDFHRFGRRPLTVGIAGDSGAGKSTLALAIAGLFGERAVTHVTGDDYHLWERHEPMWRALTHLDPRANDLRRFTQDALGMIEGRSVVARRYDHATGRFTQPEVMPANDVVIVSGLHTLYPPELRARLDLRVFVGAEDALRRHWKIARDVAERGHARDAVEASLARRAPDGKRYIEPQARHADLVFTLLPIDPAMLDGEGKIGEDRVKLRVRLREGLYYEQLSRVLIGVCGLSVDVEGIDHDATVAFAVDGEVAAEDIALAARMLVPRLDELLDRAPEWRGRMAGIMQLVTLVEIDQALRERTWR